MNRVKISTIIGTRPEIIRMSRIIERFDESFDHRLIHTGQNAQEMLSKVFFDELNVRDPDKYFHCSNESLGLFLSDLYIALEKELNENRPDAVVILGDTNSSLAALIVKRMGIPIYHLEAGNRSFDQNVPEEINRRIVDHAADFNLPYTSHGKANLIAEGIHPRTIAIMGSPLKEVLDYFEAQISGSKVLDKLGLKRGEYFLISAHRQENIDSPERLDILLRSLNAVASNFGLPVLVSTHPRTRNKISESKQSTNSLITFHDPFGFLDFARLQICSRAVLSDSGSVSEESAILGFPAITIRDSMERPEALESASIVMSGIGEESILQAITLLEQLPKSTHPPLEYLIEDSSVRVTNFIFSTVKQFKFWNGLR